MVKIINNIHSRDMTDSPSGTPTLKRIFDLYAEETIVDEQLQRVLEPVLMMINEGRFSRPRHFLWAAPPLALVTAVAVLIVTIAITKGTTMSDTFTYISSAELPLAGAASVRNILPVHVYLDENGVSGIKLTLVNAESMELFGTAVTGNDGSYAFRGVPDGTYLLIVGLPPGMAIADGMDGGTRIWTDETTELVLGGDSEEFWRGVDVQICLTE